MRIPRSEAAEREGGLWTRQVSGPSLSLSRILRPIPTLDFLACLKTRDFVNMFSHQYGRGMQKCKILFLEDQCFMYIQRRKTSQELRMLSSVTINCKLTKIVMNSGSQLSEL